ncbi:MAG TPA: ferredoxin [Candidatus Binataceae bacterium]|nr:ferredoxin [Candidatus Binataceae bacterium]
MAKLKATVNKARCIASGDCVETAPTAYQLGDDGKSEVIASSGASDSAIMSGAKSCPVKAITVIDEETGAQVFPPKK